MMSGMPLQTFSAFSKFWNNKFYYKVASCWLFLPIHTTMHGSMNIKFKKTQVFEWFSKSKSSVALVEDAECSGHPLTSKTHENVDHYK
jgi:hypothetical protein